MRRRRRRAAKAPTGSRPIRRLHNGRQCSNIVQTAQLCLKVLRQVGPEDGYAANRTDHLSAATIAGSIAETLHRKAEIFGGGVAIFLIAAIANFWLGLYQLWRMGPDQLRWRSCRRRRQEEGMVRKTGESGQWTIRRRQVIVRMSGRVLVV